MSHISMANAGLEEAKKSNWPEAARKLSVALKESLNPKWLIGRSQAFIGLKRFQDALEDANAAWHAAYERNSRPLLADAQYRRAVAYYRLEEFANADACAVFAMRLSEGHPAIEKDSPVEKYTDENGFHRVTVDDLNEEFREFERARGLSEGKPVTAAMAKVGDEARLWHRAYALRTTIVAAMNKLEQDSPKRKVTATPKPPLSDVKNKSANPPESQTQTAICLGEPVRKLSIQDYQTASKVVVTLFSKGNEAKNLEVEFLPFKVRFNGLRHPDGGIRPFELDLWGETVPGDCSYKVTSLKVELNLAKKKNGNWPQVKGSPRPTVTTEASGSATGDPALSKAEPETTKPATEDKGKGKAPGPSGPLYPSSSRTGPKNWDTLDLGDDSDEEKNVDSFFKKLYKDSTPEQQRAMMKSFTESNGTTLSTNWDDIGSRKVEVTPPPGVEAKKWD